MSKISNRHWGVHEDDAVYLFKIENNSGAFVELTNYGATLVSICVPDRNGNLGNVILGYSDLHGYLQDTAYIGSTIGRFANRIGGCKFILDDVFYILDDNDGENSNHGGKKGFNKKVFSFNISNDKLEFNLISADGEGGFPGNMNLKITFQWTETNKLLISYTASCDQNTVANFTSHAYFNLSGMKKIFDHHLTIYADQVLESKPDHIPTGKVIPAGDLLFQQNPIRDRVKTNNGHNTGLNVYYVLNEKHKTVKPAAILSEAETGRVMEVSTSYPGLMLYTGDYLNGEYPGHDSKLYTAFDGLCLECQYYPDSPNQPHFPSTVLKSGETYRHYIEFKFSTTEHYLFHAI